MENESETMFQIPARPTINQAIARSETVVRRYRPIYNNIQ